MKQFFSDAGIVFCVGLVLYLIGSSLRSRVPGPRIGKLAIVPLAGGLLLFVALMIAVGDRIAPVWRAVIEGNLTPSTPALAVPFAIMALALASLLGELALVVFPERLEQRLERKESADKVTRWSKGFWVTATSASLTGLLAIGSLAVAGYSGPEALETGRFGYDIAGDFVLPGPPMDYEAIDEHTGYMTFATGEIHLVRLPDGTGDTATFEMVASGLSFPRGVALDGGVLYVGDLGPLVCEPSYPTCLGHTPDREKEIIETSNGLVLRYDVETDLTLSNRTELVTGIPIVNTEHGINDVEVGPDGAIYVSVGGVDWMWEVPDEVRALRHPNASYLGTILRVDSATGEVSIHASGIRNVYGFDFDARGRILAADNDGSTTLGVYPEAILAIDGGEDFGYPWSGGAGVTRDKTPFVWQLTPTGGPAAVEWLDEGPWGPGLLVGARDQLIRVEMATSGDYVFVNDEDPQVEVLDALGYFTVVEQLRPDRLLVAITGIYGGTENRMLILDLKDD